VPVTGASYSPSFFVCFVDLFFHFRGFGVFLFSNSFFNFFSQESSNVLSTLTPSRALRHREASRQCQQLTRALEGSK
jgi:hypothetical protein